MLGKFHNAARCTIDGRDYFVAYLCEDSGRTLPGAQNLDSFDTEAEARAWLTSESTRRGDVVRAILDVTTAVAS